MNFIRPLFLIMEYLCLQHQSVNWHFSMEDNVKRVVARPFCGSHEKMVNYLVKGFSVDTTKALAWLEQEAESIERNVLKYQIERYADMLKRT